MSSYQIKPYSIKQARKLGVTVKTSTNASKKIDVFRNGNKIASIGASGYNDFPTWIDKKGQSFAEERRRLYKARHRSDAKVKGTNGWFASRILW